jgi:hypothetical protein
MDAHTLAGLGRDLHTRLRTFFDTPLGPDPTPLEVAQAVLDAAERDVQPSGRGRRVFPWTALTVRVLAPESARPAFAAVLRDLDARITERLAEVRCEPASVAVQVEYLDVRPASWAPGQVFDVAGVGAAPAGDRDAAAATRPTVQVTVLAGTATQTSYTCADATVSIGRSADPTDEQGRFRRNRIAFLDTADAINQTVGRAHARLRRDPATGEYRLLDEGSRNGTAILRDGEVLVVHRRDPRGVRLRSGDEIHLGRAILRIDVT